MTRDEAIEIEFKTARAWPEFNNLADMIVRKAASVAIDGYVALGMLKLDEPKCPYDDFEEELKAHLTSSGVGAIFDWLDDNKIDLVRRAD